MSDGAPRLLYDTANKQLWYTRADGTWKSVELTGETIAEPMPRWRRLRTRVTFFFGRFAAAWAAFKDGEHVTPHDY